MNKSTQNTETKTAPLKKLGLKLTKTDLETAGIAAPGLAFHHK